MAKKKKPQGKARAVKQQLVAIKQLEQDLKAVGKKVAALRKKLTSSSKSQRRPKPAKRSHTGCQGQQDAYDSAVSLRDDQQEIVNDIAGMHLDATTLLDDYEDLVDIADQELQECLTHS